MKRKLGIAFLLAVLMSLLFSFSAHAACSHASTKYVTTKAATCCTAGTRNKVCKTCGKVLQTGLKVAATGKHANVTTRVAVSPKCTTAGKLNIYCASTGKLVKTQSINALGHSLRLAQTRSATCTARGYKKYACTRCNYVRTVYTTAKLDHNFKWVSSKASTCTSDGYDFYRCTMCNTTEELVIGGGCKLINKAYLWYQYPKDTTGKLGFMIATSYCAKCGKVFDTERIENVTYTDFVQNWQNRTY